MVNNNLFYNLSTLYNQAGYWDVQDAPNPIYLNICGPLKLKPGDNKNNCSSKFLPTLVKERETFSDNNQKKQ